MRRVRGGSSWSLELFAVLCRDEFPTVGIAAESAAERTAQNGRFIVVRCRESVDSWQFLHGPENCFQLATAIGLTRTVHSVSLAMSSLELCPGR